MIGLEKVPVIVKSLKDIEMVQVALIENLKRRTQSNKEAEAYKRLVEEFGTTHKSWRKFWEKHTNHSNTLRLEPSLEYKRLFHVEHFMGHARALLAIDDGSSMRRFVVCC